jgi:hypothetical protein
MKDKLLFMLLFLLAGTFFLPACKRAGKQESPGC